MARDRKRKDTVDIQDDKPPDEELFIKILDKPFWTAKKLSPRRAVRFHHWLNGVLADMTSAIGSIDFNDMAGMDWSVIVSRAASILSEDNYFEILSIASGHTRQEIEGNEGEFDYYDAWQCVADFVEVNRLGSVITNFFLPVMAALIPKGQEEQPPA